MYSSPNMGVNELIQYKYPPFDIKVTVKNAIAQKRSVPFCSALLRRVLYFAFSAIFVKSQPIKINVGIIKKRVSGSLNAKAHVATNTKKPNATNILFIPPSLLAKVTLMLTGERGSATGRTDFLISGNEAPRS